MRELNRPEATFADLDAVPDTMVGQLIDGTLIVLPRPAIDHTAFASNAGGDINGAFGRTKPPSGWWILDEPELRLGRNCLVPDIAGWRRERLPELPKEKFFTLAPDWVLEVLSPSTASLDRIKKSRVYAREGVRWLWFADPLEKTLEGHRHETSGWLRVAEFQAGEPIKAEPFDEVTFDATDWWV